MDTVVQRHTLYRFWDSSEQLLYIGISGSPETRWRAHGRDKPWWRDVCRVTVEHFDNRADLEAAEIAAIREEKPRHNVTHNGGKAYKRRVRKAIPQHTCAAGKRTSPRRLTLIYQEPCDAHTTVTPSPVLDRRECHCANGWHVPGSGPARPCIHCSRGDELILRLREQGSRMAEIWPLRSEGRS